MGRISIWGATGWRWLSHISTAQWLAQLLGFSVMGALTYIAGQPLWLVAFVALGAFGIISIIWSRLFSSRRAVQAPVVAIRLPKLEEEKIQPQVDPLSLAIARERTLSEEYDRLMKFMDMVKGQWGGVINSAKGANDPSWGLRRKWWRPDDYRHTLKTWGIEALPEKHVDPASIRKDLIALSPVRQEELLVHFREYRSLCETLAPAINEVGVELAKVKNTIQEYGRGGRN
jgi:hypothetical protein